MARASFKLDPESGLLPGTPFCWWRFHELKLYVRLHWAVADELGREVPKGGRDFGVLLGQVEPGELETVTILSLAPVDAAGWAALRERWRRAEGRKLYVVGAYRRCGGNALELSEDDRSRLAELQPDGRLTLLVKSFSHRTPVGALWLGERETPQVVFACDRWRLQAGETALEAVPADAPALLTAPVPPPAGPAVGGLLESAQALRPAGEGRSVRVQSAPELAVPPVRLRAPHTVWIGTAVALGLALAAAAGFQFGRKQVVTSPSTSLTATDGLGLRARLRERQVEIRWNPASHWVRASRGAVLSIDGSSGRTIVLGPEQLVAGAYQLEHGGAPTLVRLNVFGSERDISESVRTESIEELARATLPPSPPSRPVAPSSTVGPVPAAPDASLAKIVPPQPIERVQPAVPPDLRLQVTTPVRVTVRVDLDETGRVTRTEPVESGDTLWASLASRATEAAQQWRFKPGTRAGRPVPSQALIDFVFFRKAS